MSCDVRQMTFDDADNAFHFLIPKLGKPSDCKFDDEDRRWCITWKGTGWVLEMVTSGVDADGAYVRPTMHIDFYPDRVKKPLLRYDAALILEPSGRPNEHMICHRKLGLLLLNNFRAFGPIGSRLADHLPPGRRIAPRPTPELTTLNGLIAGFVKIEPTRLARCLCFFGLHPLVKTDGGGMGDAMKCLVCGQDKYPEVFRGRALVSIEINAARSSSAAITGRFTDALNKSNTPKEARS